MVRLIAAAAVLLLASVTPATAIGVYGTFSGTVTSVTGTTAPGPFSLLPNAVPQVGDVFFGAFFYKADREPSDGAGYQGGNRPHGIRFAIRGQITNSEVQDLSVAVFDPAALGWGNTDAPLFIRNDAGNSSIFLELFDPVRPFPLDGALTDVWTAADFSTRRVWAAHFGVSGPVLEYAGTIDTLTMGLSVPEPSLWWLAAGFVLIIGRRLRHS